MDYAPLITATTTILVAILGGVFALLQGRKKASADAQSSIASGFQLLVKNLQEERVELTKVIDKQATENVGLKAEVSALTKTVHSLERKVDELMRSWRRGEAPPEDDGSNRP